MLAYTTDIKDDRNSESNQRLAPTGAPQKSMLMGLAVRGHVSSPDQGSLHQAGLQGPHRDPDKMPAAHQAPFHAHWSTFLGGSWALGSQTLGMLTRGKGNPHWAFLSTPPQTRQLSKQQRQWFARIPQLLPAKYSSSGCLCPHGQERFLQNELGNEADLILTLPLG